jgi:hypothetical protein
MMNARKARIQQLRAEVNQLDGVRSALLTEIKKLNLEQNKEEHPCSCVKLNGDIEIYDMQEQERRGRNPLGLGCVSECLTARKDCQVCRGTGVPIIPDVFHTCETFNPDGCAACRVIQRNID